MCDVVQTTGDKHAVCDVVQTTGDKHSVCDVVQTTVAKHSVCDVVYTRLNHYLVANGQTECCWQTLTDNTQRTYHDYLCHL